ncbi:MAG: hypothetical protein LUG86_01375 [Oscillospiraceae bacterium]|nr:hypothetical protein [Oscillospiraceae bacterium]
MALSEKITLQNYEGAAEKRFSECEKSLNELESSFNSRLGGKTTGSIIGSMVITVIWAALLIGVLIMLEDYLGPMWRFGCGLLVVLMAIAMLIDQVTDISYYGKISSYIGNVKLLRNRVSMGRISIRANKDKYLKSASQGWHCPIDPGISIYDEANSIEKSVGGMSYFKGGFVNGLKNFCYFALVFVATLVGAWALYEPLCVLAMDLFETDIDSGVTLTIWTIVLVVAEILAIILTRLCWSKTDCQVTTGTIWAVLLGPLMFVAVVAAAALVAALVYAVIMIVIVVVGIVIAGAVLFSMSEGG